MRLSIPLLALAVILTGAACRGKHQAPPVQNEEPAPVARTTSGFKMSDPAAPAQMLNGFYGLESGTWRWTAPKFSVSLRPPIAASQRGATLTFNFSVPEIVAQKVGSFSLIATSGATTLKSEKYSRSGSYTFTADVPADLLTKDSISIDFALDKSLPPSPEDHRQLGVIAVSVGLESK